MRTTSLFLAFTAFASAATAFVVTPIHCRSTTTALAATRRDVFGAAGVAVAAVLAVGSEQAAAFHAPRYDENVAEPSQLPTNGKIDLNGAFVVSPMVRGRKLTNTVYVALTFLSV